MNIVEPSAAATGAVDLVTTPGMVTVSGVPEGFDALILGDFARACGGVTVHIARDDQRLARLEEGLRFFASDIACLRFPAWDCLPYDRVSPNRTLVAERIATLGALAGAAGQSDNAPIKPTIVLTTVNAALQRVPPPDFIRASRWQARVGECRDIEELLAFLAGHGFDRVSTVNEPGEFAARGGIVDLFAPSTRTDGNEPVRLDFFGDTLESIRSFDPATQRSTGKREELVIMPAEEISLESQAIRRFRQGYTGRFGAVTGADPLYEAISEGRRFQGMEHWLPLFHETLTSLFDFVPDAPVTFDDLIDGALESRREQIADYYDARLGAGGEPSFAGPAFNPLPPEALTLTSEEWRECLEPRLQRRFTAFEEASGADNPVISLGARQGRNFAAEREQQDRNVFDALATHIAGLHAQNKRVCIAAWSAGARSRLASVLGDHGVARIENIADWRNAQTLDQTAVALGVLGLEAGFETTTLAVISEQDILGDRLVRPRRAKRKPADILSELASLNTGDLVVHADHGIGRFEGLRTLEVQGAPHDCLFLTYHDGDRLFLPVENADLLTRYGGEEAGAQLDRLGGGAWQARKARLKKRIRDIAEELIKTAAARALKTGDVLEAPDGLYTEFSARFPYDETDDQLTAIDAVLEDLKSGRPMDRLICGDVGFGKTEIALRSAFIAAMEGKQTALVVPTTLLARQHYATFVERFAGLPVKIEQLSRLVPAKQLAQAKAGLKSGEVDIAIGTHALLAKSVEFNALGLLIIDEEQHFGVAHKERLKALKSDVHVLTLSATPIPRTLQLALTGVRDLSLIATPPVDRLAVRTFITPFDPVVLREALLRELYRGGQTFYVVPRIFDLDEVASFLAEQVPEVKVARAHGQMAPGRLDDVMTAFYERKYDVLLSTSIIESGLDIPTANTLIVHRADRFGLAQLYQLRGRVGRAKTRAYAFFTVPAGRELTPNAERRLKVLQSLDTLGAGFSLASHDLDIRGAGNLLGEEQSGHIREVGFELYQDMLEEAVASLSEAGGGEIEDQWSPQINLGVSVLIPESYIEDLNLRLSLYRRLSALDDVSEIENFGAELIDRFGEYPGEVAHLLKVVAIKQHCRAAGVSSLEAGPKGCVVSFRNDQVANPAGLIAFISDRDGIARLRPDHKLVYKRDWTTPEQRIDGAYGLAVDLARIAAAPDKAPDKTPDKTPE